MEEAYPPRVEKEERILSAALHAAMVVERNLVEDMIVGEVEVVAFVAEDIVDAALVAVIVDFDFEFVPAANWTKRRIPDQYLHH